MVEQYKARAGSSVTLGNVIVCVSKISLLDLHCSWINSEEESDIVKQLLCLWASFRLHQII